jgi:hypothetical protein
MGKGDIRPTSFTPENSAMMLMEREGVVFIATNTLMAELAQDWFRPEGDQLLAVLFQEVLPSLT